MQGGGEKNLTAQSLTEKVRALYEGSAVPVREIAQIAGVGERTIYKYARKGHWKPRYAWAEDGARPHGKSAPPPKGNARGRSTTPRQAKRAQHFAPVKGAGGRFIRREDQEKPVAVGLKATDAAGAARACAACAEAAALAREAERQAQAARLFRQRIAANAAVNRAMAAFTRHLQARRRRPAQPRPTEDALEHVLRVSLALAVDRWEALVGKDACSKAALPDACGDSA